MGWVGVGTVLPWGEGSVIWSGTAMGFEGRPWDGQVHLGSWNSTHVGGPGVPGGRPQPHPEEVRG